MFPYSFTSQNYIKRKYFTLQQPRTVYSTSHATQTSPHKSITKLMTELVLYLLLPAANKMHLIS